MPSSFPSYHLLLYTSLQVKNKLRLAVWSLDEALQAVWTLVEELIFIKRATASQGLFLMLQARRLCVVEINIDVTYINA